MKFQTWLEQIEQIGNLTVLVNPTRQQLYQFIQKIHRENAAKSSANADFDIRGLAFGSDVYWWNAWFATHYEAANILALPYQKSSRLTGYIDHYGNVVIDHDENAASNPNIIKLQLDDDGVLFINNR